LFDIIQHTATQEEASLKTKQKIKSRLRSQNSIFSQQNILFESLYFIFTTTKIIYNILNYF